MFGLTASRHRGHVTDDVPDVSDVSDSRPVSLSAVLAQESQAAGPSKSPTSIPRRALKTGPLEKVWDQSVSAHFGASRNEIGARLGEIGRDRGVSRGFDRVREGSRGVRGHDAEKQHVYNDFALGDKQK